MSFKRVLIATVLLAGSGLAATAAWADDPMVNTYGNTVVAKDEATGATTDFMFNKDNTYSMEATGKDGKPVSVEGSWALQDRGKEICLTPKMEKAKPSCSPLEKHAVGDSWKTTNDQKQTFDLTLKSGR